MKKKVLAVLLGGCMVVGMLVDAAAVETTPKRMKALRQKQRMKEKR